ncbi:hypothetical protein BJX66DRAFT_329090 [Aspergillus keveii]|uniref:Uncharacterized protein n=1 Tax=Aspergillus keveii TaxID=714993 RepID=A0ABR4FR71_9EURO
MDRGEWDPIRVCGMSDPDYTTSWGKTRANANCKNHISTQSRTEAASHLQLLALKRPVDSRLFKSLRKIARLLLLRPLAERWYKSARASRVVSQHARSPRMESWQVNSPLYPELGLGDVDLILVTLIDVSLSSPARIKFGTANTDNTSMLVILRLLRQDNNGGSIGCLICHDNSADNIIYLKYERCRQSVYGVTRFDASYSATKMMGAAEDGVESAGGGHTARARITSEGALV